MQFNRTDLEIYVASNRRHAARWRELRSQGVPISSTWIDEFGPGEKNDGADLARRRITEAARADALIVYAAHQGELSRSAYIDIGAALSSGVFVYAVGPVVSDISAIRSHPRWLEYPTIEEALEAVRYAIDR